MSKPTSPCDRTQGPSPVARAFVSADRVDDVVLLDRRLRFGCGMEQAEPFFARAVALVKGPTERAALPISTEAMKVSFDGQGVSDVETVGKDGIDTSYDLCSEMGVPVSDYTLTIGRAKRPYRNVIGMKLEGLR